jgi:homoserine dehydrogenase
MDHIYGIAVVGCGTVGGATAALLIQDREGLQQRTGLDMRLKYIVDVDFTHAKELGLPQDLYESNLERVLEDDEVRVVVELVGGTTIARQITETILKAGKAVVTANKALLAHYGSELLAVAREHGTVIAFEASCGGGIPIVRALYDGLIANRIDALYGIVNGTCNYILTEMIHKGESYAEALKNAQRTGLAEADPTLDVSGVDSSHKLAIMAALAFGRRIDFDAIPVEGIDTLRLMDVKFGRELGYTVKLLAVAQRIGKAGLSLRVRPAFIPEDHPLAWVSGPFNAVSVYGHAVGHTMYYGRGAGGNPTASAIIADIVSVLRGTVSALFSGLTIWPDISAKGDQLPVSAVTGKYYLRIMVVDRPGVFARLATILGNHAISISAVLQKEPREEHSSEPIVPVVIITHTVEEGDVTAALKEITDLDEVSETVCLSIIDEHEEFPE